MATVLTRLFPTTQGGFLGRQSRRDVAVVNSEAFKENAAMDVSLRDRHERGEPRRKKAKVESDVEDEIESDEAEVEESEDEAIADAVDDDDEASRDSRTIRLRNPRKKIGAGSVGRATRRKGRDKSEEEAEQEDQSGDEDSSASSESESNAGVQWEGESDAAEEAEVEIANPNRCIFCGEDEEHDPSEDFEEYLACSVCGDNAHNQCASGSKSLSPDEDNADWRCPSCIENGVEPDKSRSSSPRRRSKSSVPKMARDLLPAVRGTIKPGSHSVFNTLILLDEPLDGSRSLRKRKASDESDVKVRPEPRKRQRRSTSEVDPLMAESTTPIDGKLESVEEVTEVMSIEQATASSPKSRGPRIRPQRRSDRPLCRILVQEENQLVIAFCLDPSKLANLDNERRKRLRRERDRARRARRAEPVEAAEPEAPVSHYPAIQTTSFVTPFYAFHDREGDESKSKPYGGILSEAEADTSKTFPQAADRKMFEDARQKAEEYWKRKVEAAAQGDLTRAIPKISGPPSKIKCINFGKYEIDTWHAAPYPEEYSRNRVLYICEFCLKYMSSDYVAWRHKLKCPAKHPPGDEIYRDGNFSFFEVDGRKNPVYCQNLCLLAKLFLGSKTLYYDVEPFLFYIMTEHDEYGDHFVGYFSKEKRPSSLNNVSCILVLPIHQRRGFGHMLIDFSYLLTKVEKKTGSPEKPLSDMGLVSYRSYWRLVLCQELLHQKASLSITDLSDRTGMTADDIACALEGLRALVRDPVTKTYALRLDYAYFQQYIDNYEKKGYTKIKPDALFWVPYVMGRDNMHYEGIPHISTIAQRADVRDDIPPEEGVQMEVNAEQAKQQANISKDGQTTTNPPATNFKNDTSEKAPPDTPALPHFPSTTLTSPIKPAPSKPPTSSTPNPLTTAIPIPPTRFEVFPPLPGTSTRPKLGRPFGRRANSRRGTPVRRPVSQSHGGEHSVTPRVRPPRSVERPPGSARRTRSNLAGGVLVDGDGDGEGGGDEEEGGHRGADADADDDADGDAVEEVEADVEVEVEVEAETGNGADEDEVMDEG